MKTLYFLILVLSPFCLLFSQTDTLLLQPGALDGKDALVASCVPCGFNDSNYGDVDQFNALSWTNDGASSKHRSLIEFDLTSIVPGTPVLSAKLSLYYNSTSIEGEHSSLTTSNASALLKIIEPWEEDSVTWDNQPAFTSDGAVLLDESEVGFQDYPDIDITALVQGMIDVPEENYGLMLRVVEEQPFNKILFASSDHPLAALHPRLEVVYEQTNGIQEWLGEEIQLMPQTGQLRIQGLPESDISLTVFNSAGQVICSERPNSRQHIIDTESYPSGVYILRWSSDSNPLLVGSRQFLVQH